MKRSAYPVYVFSWADVKQENFLLVKLASIC